MKDDRFNAADSLAPLKLFQRRTVEYVFDRLYGDQDPVRHFLVADEVGLGKTMVARGLIAKAIDHLWKSNDRIDILYICSNQAIAAQNLKRLNVLGRDAIPLPTRMTLIPLQLRGQGGLWRHKVNLVGLTPGTTFDLRSATGIASERALIFRLLEELVSHRRGLRNCLQVDSHKGWDKEVDCLTLEGIDPQIRQRFCNDVKGNCLIFEELERVSGLFSRRRANYPPALTQPRNKLIAQLRARLSHACVEALKPDLIIMDEFQRFRDLLYGKDDAATLARELFDYSSANGQSARTLLLSATPYRMLTLAGDQPEDGEHYKDFLDMVSFLYGLERGPEIAATLSDEMRKFRGQLHRLPANYAGAVETRKIIEQRLRQVMARTERVSSTKDRDSMMVEPAIDVTVAAVDLAHVTAISAVARVLDAPEIIEYWKSAPYLLNFMRGYRLNDLLKQQASNPSSTLLEALRAARPAMLNRDAIDTYSPIDPANGRLRALMSELFDSGLERHLWIPPSMPYYGSPQSGPPLTKALVFSSWSMVPDAVAALVSYEAERRMVALRGGGYFDQNRTRPLQFRQDPKKSSDMLLLYPSPTLAELADPLSVFCENGKPLSQLEMRAAIAERLKPAVAKLKQVATTSSGDGTLPEWAAPAILDDLLGLRTQAWLSADDGMKSFGREDAFKEPVEELTRVATERDFGTVPEGLSELLVDVALGSPAVCALRALRRIAPELPWDDPSLLRAAAKVGWAFRTLFNQHDAAALLRDSAVVYWRRVLTYSAHHNLQATLDEFAHYLLDAESQRTESPQDRITSVGAKIASVLSIRPSQIDVNDPYIDKAGGLKLDRQFQMRGRFAMRLADYVDDEGHVSRLSGVREAFNSPFRPFVLATTSVGQEGLDFHPYCYRVFHWNLPTNPVDLEQREGRVHRFKGHAVRLNIAEHQTSVIRGKGDVSDPWEGMFEHARLQANDGSDLIPYWIYEGAVCVERCVLKLPFSREVKRLAWLKRSLAVYRLAFGQPRQDELLAYLQTLTGREETLGKLSDLQIQLAPETLLPPAIVP